jgi:hypothetical protein
MDAMRGEIPRWPLAEVATTAAALGDRAEGGLPPLSPCPGPSARSRWWWDASARRDGGIAAWASSTSTSASLTPPPQRASPAAATMAMVPLHLGRERVAAGGGLAPLSRAAAATPASGHRSSRPWPSAVQRPWPCPMPLGREEEEITDMWDPPNYAGPTATSRKTIVETSERPKTNRFGN